MKIQYSGLPFLLLLVCCSCENKRELIPVKAEPANWVIQLSMDPAVPGQCLQQAAVNGGSLTTYPTFVPVNNGDHITWIGTYAAGGNIVYFPNGGSPDFPGTPMFNTTTGNWVRAFASHNNPLATAARLTQAEGAPFNFPYSQVVVLDPKTGSKSACLEPDPDTGMGVHIN